MGLVLLGDELLGLVGLLLVVLDFEVKLALLFVFVNELADDLGEAELVLAVLVLVLEDSVVGDEVGLIQFLVQDILEVLLELVEENLSVVFLLAL